MLTRINGASLSTVLGRDEYVMFNDQRDASRKSIVMKADDGRVYFLFDGSYDVSGSSPSSNYRDEILDLLNTSYMRSWPVDACFDHGTIGELLDWLYEDCCDVDDESLVIESATTATASVEETAFILKGYETTCIYTGQRGYHSSHSTAMNQPIDGLKDGQYRIGVELEVEAKSASLRRTINKIKSNWFMQESDGSLSDERGIEFVTIPLLPKDARSIKTWTPLVDYLKDRATSWRSSRCGLHVHIGREAFGKNENERQATLGKLLFFYYENIKPTDWNTKIFGRASTYSERTFNCKESQAIKTLGMDLMKDKKIRDKVDKGLKETAKVTRYFDINVQNALTVEFRKGKGSICADRITAIVTYCDLMVRYCKKTAWDKMTTDGFVEYVKKNAPKTSMLFRFLPSDGEEA